MATKFELIGARERHGLTINQAAELANVTPQEWADCEAGKDQLQPINWACFVSGISGPESEDDGLSYYAD
jgi:hypothetical protein